MNDINWWLMTLSFLLGLLLTLLWTLRKVRREVPRKRVTHDRDVDIHTTRDRSDLAVGAAAAGAATAATVKTAGREVRSTGGSSAVTRIKGDDDAEDDRVASGDRDDSLTGTLRTQDGDSGRRLGGAAGAAAVGAGLAGAGLAVTRRNVDVFGNSYEPGTKVVEHGSATGSGSAAAPVLGSDEVDLDATGSDLGADRGSVVRSTDTLTGTEVHSTSVDAYGDGSLAVPAQGVDLAESELDVPDFGTEGGAHTVGQLALDSDVDGLGGVTGDGTRRLGTIEPAGPVVDELPETQLPSVDLPAVDLPEADLTGGSAFGERELGTVDLGVDSDRAYDSERGYGLESSEVTGGSDGRTVGELPWVDTAEAELPKADAPVAGMVDEAVAVDAGTYVDDTAAVSDGLRVGAGDDALLVVDEPVAGHHAGTGTSVGTGTGTELPASVESTERTTYVDGTERTTYVDSTWSQSQASTEVRDLDIDGDVVATGVVPTEPDVREDSSREEGRGGLADRLRNAGKAGLGLAGAAAGVAGAVAAAAGDAVAHRAADAKDRIAERLHHEDTEVEAKGVTTSATETEDVSTPQAQVEDVSGTEDVAEAEVPTASSDADLARESVTLSEGALDTQDVDRDWAVVQGSESAQGTELVETTDAVGGLTAEAEGDVEVVDFIADERSDDVIEDDAEAGIERVDIVSGDELSGAPLGDVVDADSLEDSSVEIVGSGTDAGAESIDLDAEASTADDADLSGIEVSDTEVSGIEVSDTEAKEIEAKEIEVSDETDAALGDPGLTDRGAASTYGPVDGLASEGSATTGADVSASADTYATDSATVESDAAGTYGSSASVTDAEMSDSAATVSDEADSTGAAAPVEAFESATAAQGDSSVDTEPAAHEATGSAGFGSAAGAAAGAVAGTALGAGALASAARSGDRDRSTESDSAGDVDTAKASSGRSDGDTASGKVYGATSGEASSSSSQSHSSAGATSSESSWSSSSASGSSFETDVEAQSAESGRTYGSGFVPDDAAPGVQASEGAAGGSFDLGGFRAGPWEGSAEPDAQGRGPAGWPVKGNAQSGLYHTEKSPAFHEMKTEFWFADEASAKAAGFYRFDDPNRGKASKRVIPDAPVGQAVSFTGSTESAPADLGGFEAGKWDRSAAADAEGNGPAGWAVKGNEQSGLYHTEESPAWDAMKAEYWFVDEAAAKAAGFYRFDDPKRPRRKK